MYDGFKFAHSILRWIVLGLGVACVIAAAAGLAAKRRASPTDAKLGRFFTAALDLQFTIGLSLYFFLSPITRAVLHDTGYGVAMKDRTLRFWAIEHGFGMLLAVVLVHVGRVATRRAEGMGVHKRALIYYGLATLAIAASIPWPFFPYGRPLFSPP